MSSFGDGFSELPPELLSAIHAQMEAVQAHERMLIADDKHTVKDFLDGLNEEQLNQLDFIFSRLGGEKGAFYMRGRIEVLLQMKFDVCPCGEKHNVEDLLGPTHAPLLPDEHKGRPVEDTELPGMKEKSDDEPVEKDFQPDTDAFLQVGSLEWLAACTAWDLTVVDAENSQGFVLKCVCGMDYQSLADRKLRPKGIDGCSGCQIRSAHG